MNELSLFNEHKLGVAVAGKKAPTDIRRFLSQTPMIQNAPDSIYKRVFLSTCNPTLKEMEIGKVANEVMVVMKYVSVDVGYNIDNEKTWKMLMVRLTDVLVRYYGEFTINDIKMAFELFVCGELNQFIPPKERKHYNCFSIDYVTRILNAYKNVRNDAIDMAYKLLPKDPKTEEQKADGEARRRNKIREVFYHYKYRGKLPKKLPDGLWEVYDHLLISGLVPDIHPTEDDRRKAFLRLRKQLLNGMINKDRATYILHHQGEEIKEITATAKEIARNRYIIEAFDNLIKEL